MQNGSEPSAGSTIRRRRLSRTKRSFAVNLALRNLSADGDLVVLPHLERSVARIISIDHVSFQSIAASHASYLYHRFLMNFNFRQLRTATAEKHRHSNNGHEQNHLVHCRHLLRAFHCSLLFRFVNLFFSNKIRHWHIFWEFIGFQFR